jgi:hypothetical protein
MKPENVKFQPEQIEKILENDGIMEVEVDNGIFKYSL